jgi:hypothetical protein
MNLRNGWVLGTALSGLSLACGSTTTTSTVGDVLLLDASFENVTDAQVDGANDDRQTTDATDSRVDGMVFAPKDVPSETLTYLEDLHPVFEAANCATSACHGTAVTQGGLLLYMPNARAAWIDMIRRPSARTPRAIVTPGDPDQSELVLHAEQVHITAGVLTSQQAMLVRQWVATGAFYSRSATPGEGAPPAVSEASTCTIAGRRGFPMLPAACLPRCTRETWDRIVACRTTSDVNSCQARAIGEDSTEAQNVAGLEDSFPITCEGCLSWTTTSCMAEFCPAQFLAAQRCRFFGGGRSCETDQNTLRTCLVASAEYRACQRERDRRCAAL